jgi:hypothetical protein
MAHSLDVNRIGEVIEAIKSSDKYSRLTTWEMDFMESIEEAFRRDGGLSERRLEILEQIHMRT